MKIKLDYEDREYFHPRPTKRMLTIIEMGLPKLNWQIDVPIEELTRKEAKELIKKALRTAKRKGIRLNATPLDEINEKFDLVSV